MSETSLISISKIKLMAMLEDGVKGAKDVERLVKNSDKMLSAILIGSNFANVGATTIATAIAIRYAGSDGVALGIITVIVTIIILIVSEITPKTIAAKNIETVARFVAKPMRFFVMIFWPVSAALSFLIRQLLRVIRLNKKGENAPTVTETELKAMVNVSHEEGIIKTNERTMINNVFEFDDSFAKDVMTPRTDIAAVPVEADYGTVMEMFRCERFSRLPVYKEDLDGIVGVLHLKDIAFLSEHDRQAFNISDYMRAPFFSYELKPISGLLSEMRAESAQIAVVLDEYGGTSGIISIEDLIEEIVGDIYDEYDENESRAAEKISANEYLIDGGLKIDDFNELAGVCFKSDDYDSIGGYVVGALGKIPEAGEKVTIDNVTFTIESAARNRIEKLRVNIR